MVTFRLDITQNIETSDAQKSDSCCREVMTFTELVILLEMYRKGLSLAQPQGNEKSRNKNIFEQNCLF